MVATTTERIKRYDAKHGTTALSGQLNLTLPQPTLVPQPKSYAKEIADLIDIVERAEALANKPSEKTLRAAGHRHTTPISDDIRHWQRMWHNTLKRAPDGVLENHPDVIALRLRERLFGDLTPHLSASKGMPPYRQHPEARESTFDPVSRHARAVVASVNRSSR